MVTMTVLGMGIDVGEIVGIVHTARTDGFRAADGARRAAGGRDGRIGDHDGSAEGVARFRRRKE
jgi:hypothetical protein